MKELCQSAIAGGVVASQVMQRHEAWEDLRQMVGLPCEIEVSKAGKKTITKVVTMKRGKIIDTDFEMENE